MLGSFRIFYSGIAGLERHDIYEWQTTKNMAQGLQYEASGLLAYQMPLALYKAGVIFTAGQEWYFQRIALSWSHRFL